MRLSRSALTLVALVSMLVPLTGCFGYNRSAKRWAYVGDAVLILGGGAAIGADVAAKTTACMPDAMGNGCTYQSSIHGELLAGVVLVAAGITGIVINATRDTVKTSR
jgi:hypothetical protein